MRIEEKGPPFEETQRVGHPGEMQTLGKVLDGITLQPQANIVLRGKDDARMLAPNGASRFTEGKDAEEIVIQVAANRAEKVARGPRLSRAPHDAPNSRPTHTLGTRCVVAAWSGDFVVGFDRARRADRSSRVYPASC